MEIPPSRGVIPSEGDIVNGLMKWRETLTGGCAGWGEREGEEVSTKVYLLEDHLVGGDLSVRFPGRSPIEASGL